MAYPPAHPVAAEGAGSLGSDRERAVRRQAQPCPRTSVAAQPPRPAGLSGGGARPRGRRGDPRGLCAAAAEPGRYGARGLHRTGRAARLCYLDAVAVPGRDPARPRGRGGGAPRRGRSGLVAAGAARAGTGTGADTAPAPARRPPHGRLPGGRGGGARLRARGGGDLPAHQLGLADLPPGPRCGLEAARRCLLDPERADGAHERVPAPRRTGDPGAHGRHRDDGGVRPAPVRRRARCPRRRLRRRPKARVRRPCVGLQLGAAGDVQPGRAGVDDRPERPGVGLVPGHRRLPAPRGRRHRGGRGRRLGRTRGIGAKLTTALALPVLVWLAWASGRRRLELSLAGRRGRAGGGGGLGFRPQPRSHRRPARPRAGPPREHGFPLLHGDRANGRPPGRPAGGRVGAARLADLRAGGGGSRRRLRGAGADAAGQSVQTGVDRGRRGRAAARAGAGPGVDTHPGR